MVLNPGAKYYKSDKKAQILIVCLYEWELGKGTLIWKFQRGQNDPLTPFNASTG